MNKFLITTLFLASTNSAMAGEKPKPPVNKNILQNTNVVQQGTVVGVKILQEQASKSFIQDSGNSRSKSFIQDSGNSRSKSFIQDSGNSELKIVDHSVVKPVAIVKDVKTGDQIVNDGDVIIDGDTYKSSKIPVSTAFASAPSFNTAHPCGGAYSGAVGVQLTGVGLSGSGGESEPGGYVNKETGLTDIDIAHLKPAKRISHLEDIDDKGICGTSGEVGNIKAREANIEAIKTTAASNAMHDIIVQDYRSNCTRLGGGKGYQGEESECTKKVQSAWAFVTGNAYDVEDAEVAKVTILEPQAPKLQ